MGSISDVVFGASEDEIFATIHNYGVQSIWYTDDGGTTWTGKEGSLPDMPVKAILQSPLDPEEVIIGTELGIWYTTNFSSSNPNWQPAINGMSKVKVTDIDLRNDNAIYVSTYGRGIFSGQFQLDPNEDADGDGVLNGVDNCVDTANADQADADGNGIGDACQDTDGDGVLDIDDNCVNTANADQADADGNGVGDVCQDTDGDTIFDSDDNCIDTANTDQQDTNGNGIGDVCDTSYENPSNIVLEVVSETCEGQDNGKVIITVNETYVTYRAFLVGPGVNLTQAISSTFSFEDLAIGAYTVCVAVDDRDYEQCFEINIDEATSLDAVFGLANNGDDDEEEVTSININSGTPPFTVSFNNEVIRITNENSFEVETNGSGLLEVISSKACEGVMSKFVEGVEVLKLTASPNPVINNLKIALPNIQDDEVSIQVYDVSGKLLANRKIAVQNSNYITIPFENFSNGIYFIKLNLNTPQTLKIIKK